MIQLCKIMSLMKQRLLLFKIDTIMLLLLLLLALVTVNYCYYYIMTIYYKVYEPLRPKKKKSLNCTYIYIYMLYINVLLL